MPNPKSKARYFPHSVNLRSDTRVNYLRKHYGMEGYAVLLYFFEMFAGSTGFRIPWDDLTVELCSIDFGIDGEKLKEIVAFCIKYEILELDENKNLSAPYIDKNLQQLMDQRSRIH